MESGPERKAYSSYGFLRTEPYQPNIVPGHRQAKPTINEFDGEPYVKVIDYFMLKVNFPNYYFQTSSIADFM